MINIKLKFIQQKTPYFILNKKFIINNFFGFTINNT